VGLELHIVTGSAAPLYRQIVEQVRVAVATGALAPGQQLPSVRAVAEQLIINPNTVARAYSELVREGLAHGQPGRGLFIAEHRTVYSDEERARRLDMALDEFVRGVLFLGFTPDEISLRLRNKLDGMAQITPTEEDTPHE